jgi:hypothetical protein
MHISRRRPAQRSERSASIARWFQPSGTTSGGDARIDFGCDARIDFGCDARIDFGLGDARIDFAAVSDWRLGLGNSA